MGHYFFVYFVGVYIENVVTAVDCYIESLIILDFTVCSTERRAGKRSIHTKYEMSYEHNVIS